MWNLQEVKYTKEKENFSSETLQHGTQAKTQEKAIFKKNIQLRPWPKKLALKSASNRIKIVKLLVSLSEL